MSAQPVDPPEYVPTPCPDCGHVARTEKARRHLPACPRSYSGGHPRKPLDERFAALIRIEGECWVWTAFKNREGYGKFKVNRRSVIAHRWAYERFVGPIPDGLQIDHLCRVRACVNPAHLEAVTGRENLLRGNTFQARNAAKTHCAHGHPFDEANTRVLTLRSGGKGRECRTCQREKDRRRYWAAKREVAS